jgi:hypothetical protein
MVLFALGIVGVIVNVAVFLIVGPRDLPVALYLLSLLLPVGLGCALWGVAVAARARRPPGQR